MNLEVTPCVGVWIETIFVPQVDATKCVTPCVGVWIETGIRKQAVYLLPSHPAWVCGLKLSMDAIRSFISKVTPCVGVWIETRALLQAFTQMTSHPAWVCGLKLG